LTDRLHHVLTPEEFSERLKTEMTKWGKVVRDTNIRAD
jgi:tripartite-type tricarboxylate transporter receptor subunit TctC